MDFLVLPTVITAYPYVKQVRLLMLTEEEIKIRAIIELAAVQIIIKKTGNKNGLYQPFPSNIILCLPIRAPRISLLLYPILELDTIRVRLLRNESKQLQFIMASNFNFPLPLNPTKIRKSYSETEDVLNFSFCCVSLFLAKNFLNQRNLLSIFL